MIGMIFIQFGNVAIIILSDIYIKIIIQLYFPAIIIIMFF